MIDALVTVLIALGSSVATSVGTWIFARRRNKAETLAMVDETYNKIISSMQGQIDRLLENEKMKDEKIEAMGLKIDELTAQVGNLKEELNKYKN